MLVVGKARRLGGQAGGKGKVRGQRADYGFTVNAVEARVVSQSMWIVPPCAEGSTVIAKRSTTAGRADTFISTAVIRVLPPQVPEKLVPSNVNAELDQRINSMTQTILSRTALSSIIQTYNLYPSERRGKPIEDVIEIMRKVRGGIAVEDEGGWLFTATDAPGGAETHTDTCWNRCHVAAPNNGVWFDYTK